MSSPASARAAARSTWLFCAAVFVSAFLLFQVQPLISKAILPWFGGTPSVWTTCLLFFQVVLFAGYLYAHLVSVRLPVRVQSVVHVLLIVAALSLLNILPAPEWKPSGEESPVLRIVLLLSATVGLPYFILSTTGPLLQRWYSLVLPHRSPYPLYSLSNTGSLLALLTYPFLVEPRAAMSQQGQYWQWGFWAFAALCAGCILRLVRSGAGGHAGDAAAHGAEERKRIRAPAKAVPPTLGKIAAWFILSLAASAMLLATTNHVCQDVAVVPFLWVVPLSLYLLSFILCFGGGWWYRRQWWAAAMAALVLGIGWVFINDTAISLREQTAVYFGALFAMCMVCHGELARMRPPPEHLTAFYLTLSAGGAGGGLFVALLAPLLFPDYWEFHLCLGAGTIIAVATFFHARGWIGTNRRPPLPWLAAAMLLVAVVGVMFADRWQEHARAIAVERNFYGVLRVERAQHQGLELTLLRNGRTIHGLQFDDPEFRDEPTSYFSRSSGVGRVAQVLAERGRPLRIGIIGLGVGTLAAYGRTGDVIRFYEINAADVHMAREHFTFLQNSGADIEIVLGDARVSLEREPPQQFDLLVLDAFLGDAVPAHLLTREAMALYLRHMLPDGVITVHVSNQYFDLTPVVSALAGEFGLSFLAIHDPGGGKTGNPPSSWAVLAAASGVLADPRLAEGAQPAASRPILWTDDYSNVFRLLR